MSESNLEVIRINNYTINQQIIHNL